MKLYRNVSEIRSKEALGRRLSLISVDILFVGLLASFVPSWFPPKPPGCHGQRARVIPPDSLDVDLALLRCPLVLSLPALAAISSIALRVAVGLASRRLPVPTKCLSAA